VITRQPGQTIAVCADTRAVQYIRSVSKCRTFFVSVLVHILTTAIDSSDAPHWQCTTKPLYYRDHAVGDDRLTAVSRCTQHPIQRVLKMLPRFKAAGAWHWRVAFCCPSCERMELYIHSRMASLRCTEFNTWLNCLFTVWSAKTMRLWRSGR